MKRRSLREEKPQTLKKRLMSALVMLLISTLMLSTSTFAWFVLSTAPEVTGIETQVGANGSLEIALLNTETRSNMSSIRAGLGGGSLQENQVAANNVWGNLIDLGYASYGLGELTLLPARLDATANGNSYSVDVNKLLSVPSYGYDGRIIELSNDTASAIFKDNDFMYSGAQDYGVRAIGTSDALSPQGSALSSAKTNISTWTKSARSGAQAALTDNMSGLFEIILGYALDKANAVYDDTHKATLDAMLVDLEGVLTYLDNSLRQGLVAYVASEIGDELAFTTARDKILNTDNALVDLLDEVEADLGDFALWVDQLAAMQNNHGLAKVACAGLTDNEYTWTEIKGVLEHIMNMDKLLINGNTIDKLDANSLMLESLIEMTLAPGSGLFADVADFTDNYSVSTEYSGKNVEMSTASIASPKYLPALSTAVNTLEPADGGESASALPLTATYGYAIDLAFRCNAADPDLVLQTKGVQRVYSGGEDGTGDVSTSGSTQGGGSYMEFTSMDKNFTLEQQLSLMDAIRVGFVDDQGSILAIAKLNVTSREVDKYGAVKAPLYLYDYTFETDELTNGLVLTMGERKLTDNLITDLEQNVAKAVTAVVWLDGDIVDNTMVSATSATSLDGVLNLQFATSAELIPAVDGAVMTYTADKSGLDTAVEAARVIAEAGQGTYTNLSWTAFMNAYSRATDVNDNLNASHIEIRNAVDALSKTVPALAEVSVEALQTKTQEVREVVGTVEEIGAYVLDKGDEGYVAVTEGTKDELGKNKATLNSVDHDKNKKDEGSGVYTPVYTDATWNALVSALYQAEAVALNKKSTDDQINASLTALDEAQKALEFAVYYIPYEYNGSLYYMAQSETEAEDTYGRWYDSEFKRIFADVMILKLDAYAKKAQIVQMAQAEALLKTEDYITPDIAFLTEVYPELNDVEIKAVQWSGYTPADDNETALFTEMMMPSHYSTLSSLIAIVDSEEFKKDAPEFEQKAEVTAAKEIVTRYENVEGDKIPVTASEANTAITNLNKALTDHYEAKAEAAKSDDAVMTENLRVLLTKAVNAAKAVEDEEKQSEIDAAVTAAESLLADEKTTNKQATDSLTKLNGYLDEAVTEDNTMVQKIPGFDSTEFVYDVDYPGITLKLNGESGIVTLQATVLTNQGVITTVSKQIKLCDPAEDDGIKVIEATDKTETALTSIDLDLTDADTNNDTKDLAVMLLYTEGEETTETPAEPANTEGEPEEEPEAPDKKELIKETIVEYIWATNNKEVATVSGNSTATVKGVGNGSTKIYVSVKTDCGSSYVYELTVNVTASAEPEEPETPETTE